MASFLNSFAFAFPGIIPFHNSCLDSHYSKSYIPYRTLQLVPTFRQDIALRFLYTASKPQSWSPQEERRKNSLSRKLSPIKAVEIQEALPEGLNPELMPKHVAIVLDGNRRWAKERHLPVERGHLSGGRATRNIASLCNKWGIKVLSVFAFSTENWTRPEEEVELLMDLFEEQGKKHIEEMMRQNIRFIVIGDRSKLPESLQEILATGEEKARGNTGLHHVVALNYSGRYDIVQATKIIAGKVKDGFLGVEDINEAQIDKELETNCLEYPNPDFLIRTSGEQRISNFFLWQLADSEIYFSNKKLPDFKEEDFIEALIWFQKRKARCGGNMG